MGERSPSREGVLPPLSQHVLPHLPVLGPQIPTFSWGFPGSASRPGAFIAWPSMSCSHMTNSQDLGPQLLTLHPPETHASKIIRCAVKSDAASRPSGEVTEEGPFLWSLSLWPRGPTQRLLP